MKFSVCMIVRDEETILTRCLDCVNQFSDELIIVDTGSTDRTKEIARQYTDHVHDFVWVDDFAAARNYSYSFATGDYIMWVDADDVIDTKNAEEINKLKGTLTPDIDTVFMLCDIPQNGNCSMRQRLERRSSNPVWVDALHESIPLRDKCMETEIMIKHQKSGDNNSQQKLKIPSDLLAKIETLDFRLKSQCWLDLHRRGRMQDAELVYQSCLRDIKATTQIDAVSCLLIGSVLQNMQEYQNAVKWYEMAVGNLSETLLPSSEKELFQICQQMVKCLFRLGKKAEAQRYNHFAGEMRPDCQSVKLNAIILQS